MNTTKTVLLLVIATLLSACGNEHSAQWLEKKYSNDASKFINIDGNRVHYRDEGQGPVVVLLHGTTSSLHTWDEWAETLTNNFRVIRMDLPGFGLTGPDRSHRYEVAHDVTFLNIFLQALNVQQAHMVGSSLGGRIAWQYALDFPEQVKSLTLLNALGYAQASWPPGIEMAQWPLMDKLMPYVSARFMFEHGLKEVYFDEKTVTASVVDRYFELSRYPGNATAFPKRVQARLDKDSEDIKKITQPTLILWGEKDLYFPVENAHRFKHDISISKIHTYPDVGHLPMEEVPQLSLQHFDEFVNDISQP